MRTVCCACLTIKSFTAQKPSIVGLVNISLLGARASGRSELWYPVLLPGLDWWYAMVDTVSSILDLSRSAYPVRIMWWTSIKFPDIEKLVYSAIHILLWTSKPNTEAAACSTALHPLSGRGVIACPHKILVVKSTVRSCLLALHSSLRRQPVCRRCFPVAVFQYSL